MGARRRTRTSVMYVLERTEPTLRTHPRSWGSGVPRRVEGAWKEVSTHLPERPNLFEPAESVRRPQTPDPHWTQWGPLNRVCGLCPKQSHPSPINAPTTPHFPRGQFFTGCFSLGFTGFKNELGVLI